MNKILKLAASIIVLLMIFSQKTYTQSLQTLLADDIYSIVDQSGSGDYTTVQEAIDAIPDNNPSRKVIFVKKGVYHEYLIIPVTKPNVTLVGEHLDSTIITYDSLRLENFVVHTFVTHSVRVDADDFWAMNLTFENAGGETAQALAIFTNGDRQIFTHCRFISYQDTWFTNIRTRNYLKDCFIEGGTDYIFGFGIAVFDSCQIHTIKSGGYLTAASTFRDYKYGLTFLNSKLTSHYSGSYLGRPWFDYARTVFYKCNESGISPAGWSEWGEAPWRDTTCYYREYKCTGPNSDTTSRVSWSGQLTETEAAKYVLDTIFSLNSMPIDAIHDTSEPLTIHRRFDSRGYPQQSEYFLKAGRDTFIPYPTVDWHVDIEDDSIYSIIKQNTIKFMDTLSYNLPINNISYNEDVLPGFDPDSNRYAIELEPEDTMPGNVTVDAPGTLIKIDYPQSLPGFTIVSIYSQNKLNYTTYNIYNSIDSAYWNPNLAFIRYLYKIGSTSYFDTIFIEPGQDTYDVKLPTGVTNIPTTYPQVIVAGTLFKREYVNSLPSTTTITTTALDTSLHATYYINFSVETDIDEKLNTIPCKLLDNPLYKNIRFEVEVDKIDVLQIAIYDMSGRIIMNEDFKYLPLGKSIIEMDASNLQEGSYIYYLKMGELRSTGKLIKRK